MSIVRQNNTRVILGGKRKVLLIYEMEGGSETFLLHFFVCTFPLLLLSSMKAATPPPPPLVLLPKVPFLLLFHMQHFLPRNGFLTFALRRRRTFRHHFFPLSPLLPSCSSLWRQTNREVATKDRRNESIIPRSKREEGTRRKKKL